MTWFLRHRADEAHVGRVDERPTIGAASDGRTAVMASVVSTDRLRRLLARVLDPDEFLSPHGLRSLSRWHAEHPFSMDVAGLEASVDYEPAESRSRLFGGNSNWRGPVWMPVNMLIVRALFQLYLYYGDDFKIECPTGSGTQMTLYEVGIEIANRLTGIFLRDADGRRPVFGGTEKFQHDPHWRDHLLFYEYFHGDNGAGLGASHQTGWTGVVARLIQVLGYADSRSILEGGSRPFMRPYTK
jgi:hypothetical protein